MRKQPEANQPKSKKPEWFQLLDGDAPSAQVTKVDKKLPIIAALVTGAVVASGALFAGASAENSTDQSAVASIAATTEPAIQASTPTIQASTPTIQASTPTTPSVTNSAVSNPVVSNPAGGMQAPGANGGDDDDDDHEGRERHERGEGRDRDHDDDD